MKEIVIQVPEQEAEFIGRIAALQGRSVEEYTLHALRHIAEADAGEAVADVAGIEPEAVFAQAGGR